MQPDQLLLLNYDDFTNKINEMLIKLKDDENYRRAFLFNPAEVGFDSVFKNFTDITVGNDESIYQSNRLLFLMISNQEFIQWSKEYQQKITREARLEGKTIDKMQALRDVAEAFINFGNSDIILSIIQAAGSKDQFLYSSPPKKDVFTHTNTVYTTHSSLMYDVITMVAYFTVFFVVSQIDLTPVVSVYDDFQSVLSPADLQSLADSLVAYANQLKEEGRLSEDWNRLNNSPSYR
jgi:hypothetical protein